jgi:hypothetical protein
VLKNLGIGGGIAGGLGFVCGLILIWWLEPPVASGVRFLLFAPAVILATIGAIIGAIVGWIKK